VLDYEKAMEALAKKYPDDSEAAISNTKLFWFLVCYSFWRV
jgi:hypothetical protein